MDAFSTPKPSTAEVLRHLERHGAALTGTTTTLVEHDGQLHRRDCPHSPRGPRGPQSAEEHDLLELTQGSFAPCCAAESADLPGKLKNQIGRALLRWADLALRALNAVRDAPEPHDLPSALAALEALSLHAELEHASEGAGWPLAPDPVTESMVSEVLDHPRVDTLRRQARAVVADGRELSQHCWEAAVALGTELTRPPDKAVCVNYGHPRGALSGATDPLVRATLTHCAGRATLLVVPGGVWAYWLTSRDRAAWGNVTAAITLEEGVDAEALMRLVDDDHAQLEHVSDERLSELAAIATCL